MMKRILLVMVMMLLVSATVSAQLPPRAYYGLYVDDTHTTYCITGPGSFTIYCMVWPSDGGLDSVEFKVTPSAGMIIYLPELNPDIILSMGTFPGELVATFGTCWLDWTVICSASLMVSGDGTNQEEVIFEPYTGSPFLKFVDCDGIEEEAVALNYLYANYPTCPEYASRESTWGAIKNMYE